MKDSFTSLASGLAKATKKGASNGNPNAGSLFKEMVGLPVHVVEGVTGTIGQITEYLRVAEQENTKRTEILAKRDVALATVRAQRDSFMKLMHYTFQERAAVIQKQFEALDHALANNNAEIVTASLNAMVSVIKTSPFKDAQEMHKALGSKDFVVRLE